MLKLPSTGVEIFLPGNRFDLFRDLIFFSVIHITETLAELFLECSYITCGAGYWWVQVNNLPTIKGGPPFGPAFQLHQCLCT